MVLDGDFGVLVDGLGETESHVGGPLASPNDRFA